MYITNTTHPSNECCKCHRRTQRIFCGHSETFDEKLRLRVKVRLFVPCVFIRIERHTVYRTTNELVDGKGGGVSAIVGGIISYLT